MINKLIRLLNLQTEKLTSSDTAHTAEKTLLSSKLADVENRLAMAEDQNRTLTEENKALENQLQTAGGGGDNNAHDQKLQVRHRRNHAPQTYGLVWFNPL